jgi:hypothetical protein
MGFSKWALVELVEAGVRSGMPEPQPHRMIASRR